jgi:hypothetical protein
MQRHGDFAAQVEAVRDRSHGRAPGGARRALYSEALAEGMLAALAEGFALTEICADPGFPAGYGTVQRWIATRPDFAARYHAACAPRQTPQGLRIGRGRRGGYDPALADRITERLLEGRSLRSISRDPDMPGTGVMAEWRARRLEFRQAMAHARRAQMDVLIDEVLSLRDHPWPGRCTGGGICPMRRRFHLYLSSSGGPEAGPGDPAASGFRLPCGGLQVAPASLRIRAAGSSGSAQGAARRMTGLGFGGRGAGRPCRGLQGAPASLRIRAAGSSGSAQGRRPEDDRVGWRVGFRRGP